MSDPTNGGTPAARLAPVDPASDTLFVYGTLRFRRILTALLGHVPSAAPATVTGWRTAALRGRPYPGLVPAPGRTAHGLLLTGLDARAWRVLDAFEDDEYALRRLTARTAAGPAAGPGTPVPAWSYTWTSPAQVRPDDWEADTFAGQLLDGYATRLEQAAHHAPRRGTGSGTPGRGSSGDRDAHRGAAPRQGRPGSD
ncbi:gamma-glutamylcyclotransferase [Streptomyces albus subsp. chlorinus]|uniref:gamma-glutamylcyclotransferase n=1 Tax=Streptomyces albus TaxID=1888 RepID=UPI00156E7474|nr:gamma-glutamylcyclotransferase [Streptomyces albus subsp. chlorinus]